MESATKNRQPIETLAARSDASALRVCDRPALVHIRRGHAVKPPVGCPPWSAETPTA